MHIIAMILHHTHKITCAQAQDLSDTINETHSVSNIHGRCNYITYTV